ncbi:MAG: CRISPR-associated endonuclease Cas1 [Prosthecobacter sp.]|uniref:CRISPR-associated endonuclease Cas4g/Cas1g n=1 Tax=Prosthecobacter sp. TaxID=1965333 RepID=UPI0038FE4897
MNAAAPIQTQDDAIAVQPPLPVRRLHNFIYCPRLFYYQWVENLFEENADTVAGSTVHRNVDKPSAFADEKQAALAEGLPEGARLRSLKLESIALGLVGVIDLIEGAGDDEIPGLDSPRSVEVVDYKKGSAKRGANGERVAKESDAVQVMAHALLLEEEGTRVTRGWIYYTEDKRRVPVELTAELREQTLQSLAAAKAQAASGHCPPPLVNDPRCLYCSAYPICLPNESRWWAAGFAEKVDHDQMAFVFADVAAKTDLKSEISDFKLPAELVPPRPDGDAGEILVVHTPGAQVGQRGDMFTVSIKGEVVQKMPGHQLRAIYLYGAVQLTAQAVQTALELDIDVSYFSPAGRFLGLLRGLPTSGVDARMGQYEFFQKPVIRLRLAREIIRAKIHNQRVLLMRNGDAPDSVLKRMAELRDGVAEVEDLTVLLGYEGMAAAFYFEHFTSMLKGRGEAWKFDFQGRNKRPPRDPVNSLLSLAYSMLAKELTGVIHAVGLDPFLGFLHQPRYGRPALALDLMEEFRPLIADSVVISLINRGELGVDDFVRSANGTFLKDAGRRAFWEAYFRRMDSEVSHPEFGYKMSYRRMLEVQARQLWRYLRGEAAGYHGFTTR